jgi:hypothetical protein
MAGGVAPGKLYPLVDRAFKKLEESSPTSRCGGPLARNRRNSSMTEVDMVMA